MKIIISIIMMAVLAGCLSFITKDRVGHIERKLECDGPCMLTITENTKEQQGKVEVNK